ncbi:cation diffusion facilitator family transporter [Pseudobutyrivibrio sp. YE44]|uniref:cation diffusion facilitator family transporter n=1 Tax=Pseudobutyrivibrio sp. YE44 TaxID=1520802 RepID=UPI00088B89BA|nr:cation diffusion facilitator family transporter [Pseudobutyrivibrio sp. YE44]SDB25839.1 cation diffusion facilitator family transporter [Pseudobutyrivibrio sp. YE44]
MDENTIVKKLSRIGILGNVALSAFKLVAGIIGNSTAMVSDAIHSLSDVFATLIAYVGVLMSRQPEDNEHPYGHERLECVASLLLGTILAVTGLGIGYSGVHKIIFPRELEIPTILPLIAAVVSILVKEGMFWYTMYYAKKLDSSAFKADAWHHRSDAISSVGSFIGIGMAKLGFPIMDPVASLLICLCILKVAYDISKDAFIKMLDTSCGEDFEQELSNFILEQPGVVGIDLLHTRQFGNRNYVELEIAVNRDISLVEAHDIAENVHASLEKNYPNIKHVMIHVNPAEEKNEACSDIVSDAEPNSEPDTALAIASDTELEATSDIDSGIQAEHIINPEKMTEKDSANNIIYEDNHFKLYSHSKRLYLEIDKVHYELGCKHPYDPISYISDNHGMTKLFRPGWYFSDYDINALLAGKPIRSITGRDLNAYDLCRLMETTINSESDMNEIGDLERKTFC